MLKIDRRLIVHFDWPLLAVVILIIAWGVATVLSATYTPARAVSSVVIRQLIWAGVGLIMLLATLSFDYRRLESWAYFIYAGALLLLVMVPVLGAIGGGSRRWLILGPASLQPSEFMKLALVIALARWLHRLAGDEPLPLRALWIPIVLFAPAALLILKQPDLGTALVLTATVGSLILLAGFRIRYVLLALAIAVPVLPYLWHHLKTYQKQRLLTFLDPMADPLGAGYHVIQSQIAIGSGQFWGKGFLHGTQSRLNFLPEQHTDFIFSVFAEEWGFVGAVVLVTLYLALLIRCFMVASRAKDNFGILLAFGITATIFWQVLINLGMATGSLPVVGITLPFFSYGGSSLLALMIGIGLLININMRRFTF
ncbi:MAG TPA: rod shape-determining protein RodA [Candidatus Kryptonia bacterium]|nr:rod shape-determining protein RodA [Candidatus Kryptonia bacterium]